MDLELTKSNLRTLFYVPWFSLAAAILLGILLTNQSENVGAWALIASALVFGLPHGACDLWILQQSIIGERRFLKIVLLLTIYLGAVIFTVWAWLNFAPLCLFAFLLLSAWHFGSGDSIWTSRGRTDFLLQSSARGLIIITAPLAFHPAESRIVLLPLAENAALAELIWQAAPALLAIGIVLQLSAILMARRAAKSILLIETILIIALFGLTTPLFAVALYLIGVHSWRHLWRLENNFGNASGIADSWRVAAVFHLRALPLTVAAIAGLALIHWLWRVEMNDLSGWTKAYLILLSALTVPHAALVLLMEIKRGHYVSDNHVNGKTAIS